MDGGRYVARHGIDPGWTVDAVIAHCLHAEGVTPRLTLVSLRLVKRGPGVPTAEEEEHATPLNEPRATLRGAGVADGSSLLLVMPGAPARAAFSVISRA